MTKLGQLVKKIRGRNYVYLIGSDVVRDGIYLELSDVTGDPAVVLEIFYSDKHHDLGVTLFRERVPLEVLEYAMEEARSRLLPTET